MTAGHFRAVQVCLRSMIGSVFAPGRTRNAIWRVILSLLTINSFLRVSSFTLPVAGLPPEHAKRLPRYDAIPAALFGDLYCAG
jgi:hypothetical protein